jgi:hypothetical protein
MPSPQPICGIDEEAMAMARMELVYEKDKKMGPKIRLMAFE